MRYKKLIKGQGLPLNIIVMLIIGIVLFGLGMGLFTKVFNSSDDTVEDLGLKIESNIASLECDGEQWICSPSNKMKNADSKNFKIFIANRNPTEIKTYRVEIAVDADNQIHKEGCGNLIIKMPDKPITVQPGHSAMIPFNVKTLEMSGKKCSFVTKAILNEDGGNVIATTPIIIRIG